LPLAPTLTGPGAITSWEITPALPTGLTFSTSNATVWGTPTVLQTSPVTYTIWANNSGGSSSATINITIVDEVPTLSYSPENLALTNNMASGDLPLAPTLTGSGAITSWAISPALPSGLSFGTSNGTIWGTPTVLQTSPVTYTIWANNSAHSQSFDVTLTVVNEEVFSEDEDDEFDDDGFDWLWCFLSLVILMILLSLSLKFGRDLTQEEEEEEEKDATEALVETENRL
jgi:hypothetical protein